MDENIIIGLTVVHVLGMEYNLVRSRPVGVLSNIDGNLIVKLRRCDLRKTIDVSMVIQEKMSFLLYGFH